MNLFGMKCSLYIVVLSLLIGAIISSALVCSCSKVNMKEALSLMGSDINSNMTDGVPGDIWKTPSAAKKTSDNLYHELENNEAGNIPLPEGELDLFYKNKFDPACCYSPQSYSSSTGCACLSVKQMKYLAQRAGNNSQ